jgi:hypothetical protein
MSTDNHKCSLCTRECLCSTSSDKCCHCADTSTDQKLYIDGTGAVNMNDYYLQHMKTLYYCKLCRDPKLPSSAEILEVVVPFIAAINELRQISFGWRSMSSREKTCSLCNRGKYIDNYMLQYVKNYRTDYPNMYLCSNCEKQCGAVKNKIGENIWIVRECIEKITTSRLRDVLCT